MRKTFLTLLLALNLCCPCLATDTGTPTPAVVPLPEVMTCGEGQFVFGTRTRIWAPSYPGDSLRTLCRRFADTFCAATNLEMKVGGRKGSADIRVNISAELSPEAYRLRVTPENVCIEVSRPAGLFYALQTVKQLLPAPYVAAGRPAPEAVRWTLPVVQIEDSPRFPWRGFMLDEGRHFFGKEEVKRVLDMMATYKMNRFHWHLTEDQGWRLEIPAYPRLTSVGAWRDSKVLPWGDVKADGRHYGGFYTADDVREIVAYARDRFIEILPEIDIPGHSQAAVAAYPELLACDPERPHTVWVGQGVSTDVINVANPQAVKWAKDVVDHLITLFPFGYIHLGGDECPTRKWEQNAQCQARLKELGSTKYRDLQIDFYHQIQQHINAKPAAERRKLVFWNEVLHGNTSSLCTDSIVIMAWIGADKAAREAAGRGMDNVLSPQIPYYINRRQARGPQEPLSQGHGTESVEAVYHYAPAKGVPGELLPHYTGVQANFWTEWVEESPVLEYLMLPRLAAVAEAGWTPQERRHWPDFKARIRAHAPLYELRLWNYGGHLWRE